jgi:1-acyl-sn-glycerol-3-phosphate acyltransferase
MELSTLLGDAITQEGITQPKKRLELEPLYRLGAKKLICMMYNIRFIGFSKIPDTGPVLIISNHISYVDGLIINALCKRKVRFIIDKNIYEKPVINYFMRLNRAIPIAPNREEVSHALDLISEGLRQGDAICIFPEGQITYTGYLSHFRPGIEWIINRDPVPVYPIALHGLWGSVFSRKYKQLWQKLLPRSFRRNVTALCGNAIAPEEATIDTLQLAVLQLRNTIAD